MNALPGGSQPESATVAQSYNSEDAGPPTNFPKGRRIVSQTREGTNDPDMLVSSSGRKRSAETQLSRALSSDSDIPLAPSSKKTRLLSRMASGRDDEYRLEAVQAERSPRFQISPSRSSFDEQQPDSDLQTESATPVSQPSFGLANIIGKDKPRKGRGFTLKDVVPDQRPKGVNSNSTTQQLKGFYDSLRASFPPVVVGPDYIQHGPSKKGTFTLGDVTNTGTLEPLFDVQHAIDQHKARGDGGSAGRKTDIRE